MTAGVCGNTTTTVARDESHGRELIRVRNHVSDFRLIRISISFSRVLILESCEDSSTTSELHELIFLVLWWQRDKLQTTR